MKMLIGVVLCTLCSPAWSANGIQLSQLVVKDDKAAGRCGAAMISIRGLTQSDASGHANIIEPSGEITVVANGRKLVVGKSEPMFLQDRTMAACLDTPQGARLVVATFCDGRSCEPVHYVVIDPASLAQGPVRLEEPCTLLCVERALNTPVPAPLRDQP